MPKFDNHLLLFNLAVSIFGIILTIALTFNPPFALEPERIPWRKTLICSIFSLICFFGIIAAIFPKQCSKKFHFKEKTSVSQKFYDNFKGHHPACKEFSAHVIKLNNHVLCAACIGMILGASMALSGMAFYLFGLWQIENISKPLILVGVAGVTLGFFQLKFRGIARSILNAAFVFGAFLILIGFDVLTQNLFFDLFLILLIILWLFTRIELSRWDHLKICRRCKLPCEIYGLRKGGIV
ncbi:MAG: hypothetical protein QXM86_02005 [Candidatus Bathyarchaeia archaeon]